MSVQKLKVLITLLPLIQRAIWNRFLSRRVNGYSVSLLFLLSFSCFNLHCKKEDNWREYTIPKGAHSSGLHFRPIPAPLVYFKAKFDHTAIYNIGPDQTDINKLYGFSEGDHRQNGARIGWRWMNDSIQLFGYTHLNGNMHFKYITSITIGQEAICRVYAGDKYYFNVNGYKVEMERANKVGPGNYCLFPYFGGNRTAPRKIIIKIIDK